MGKKLRPTENRMIDKNILVSIFKQMKMDPLKVFVARDFFDSRANKQRRYLNVLVYLGIIEQVPGIYTCGKYDQVKRTVKGYKLLNQGGKTNGQKNTGKKK